MQHSPKQPHRNSHSVKQMTPVFVAKNQMKPFIPAGCVFVCGMFVYIFTYCEKKKNLICHNGRVESGWTFELFIFREYDIRAEKLRTKQRKKRKEVKN